MRHGPGTAHANQYQGGCKDSHERNHDPEKVAVGKGFGWSGDAGLGWRAGGRSRHGLSRSGDGLGISGGMYLGAWRGAGG